MNPKSFAALAFCCFVFARAFAATLPDDARIRALLEEQRAAGRIVGAVVGILDGGQERYLVVGGREKGGTPPDADTVFEIGSITKAFTGVLLAQLVADGKVKLDQGVAELAPPGVTLPEPWRKTTLRELATHTAGLPRMPAGFRPASRENPFAAYTREELWKSLEATSPAYEPDASRAYSNLGFMLLSDILVRAASSASYAALVREKLLCPAGMDACKPHDGANVATPHDPRMQATPPWDNAPELGGVGMLRMSARDLVRFAKANMADAGPLAAAVKASQAVHWEKVAPQKAGLGWQVRTTKSGRTIHWHNGGTGGSRAYMGFDRASGQAVVILVNSTHDVTALGMHLIAPDETPYPPAAPASAPAAR